MKRDMELIREVLLLLEAYPLKAGSLYQISQYHDEPELIAGRNFDEVLYHVNLLIGAGFLNEGSKLMNGSFLFTGLSWEGHDFLDSVRDGRVWEATKKISAEAGVFTLDGIKQVAVEIAKGLATDLIKGLF